VRRMLMVKVGRTATTLRLRERVQVLQGVVLVAVAHRYVHRARPRDPLRFGRKSKEPGFQCGSNAPSFVVVGLSEAEIPSREERAQHC